MLESLKIALDALRANKMRSALTMLGVTIGVTAVILLVSIVTGLRQDISRQIEGLGSDLLIVLPGQVEAGPGGGGGPFDDVVNRLTRDDARNIERGSPHVSDTAPLIQNNTTLRFGNRSRQVPVVGTTPSYATTRNFPVQKGRFLLEADVQGTRKVILIGQTIQEEFFGGRDSVGERVTLGGQKFTVIGVMSMQGGLFGVDLDDQVWIPITVAENLFGVDRVGLIYVEATSADDILLATDEATRVLSRRLDEGDFSILAQEEILGTFQSISGILTLALGGIAGISLLVGGIGIMNIMLVSVTERTREIGIRKAVGARRIHIIGQFIAEAVTLSAFGGAFGVAIAAAASLAIRGFLPSEISLWSVVLAFGFSVGVGVFFGVYPAVKASRLDPIVSLRYQ